MSQILVKLLTTMEEFASAAEESENQSCPIDCHGLPPMS